MGWGWEDFTTQLSPNGGTQEGKAKPGERGCSLLTAATKEPLQLSPQKLEKVAGRGCQRAARRGLDSPAWNIKRQKSR